MANLTTASSYPVRIIITRILCVCVELHQCVQVVRSNV